MQESFVATLRDELGIRSRRRAESAARRAAILVSRVTSMSELEKTSMVSLEVTGVRLGPREKVAKFQHQQ